MIGKYTYIPSGLKAKGTFRVDFLNIHVLFIFYYNTHTHAHNSVLIPEFLIQDHQLEKDQLHSEEYHVSRKKRRKGRTPRYG